MGQEKTVQAGASGSRCGCSFFSCCVGCLGGALLCVLAVVGTGVAGYYYLPGYLEKKVAEARKDQGARANQVFAKAKADPISAEQLANKVEAFSRTIERGKSAITVTEHELNAWLVENLVKKAGQAPLEAVAVQLLDGKICAAARMDGPRLARQIPDEAGMGYLKGILGRTKVVDLMILTRCAVKDGRIDLVVESCQIGPFPIPAMLVNSAIQQNLRSQKAVIGTVTITELTVKPGKIHIRSVSKDGSPK